MRQHCQESRLAEESMTIAKRVLLFLAGIVLCLPLLAMAGFEDSYAALQAGDYPKALAEARQAADKGDPRACFLLGTMYQAGLGVEASSKDAAGWYEKAAQGGVAPAHSRLAQFYARGDGVPKDPDRALKHARKAAMLDDPEGMVFLYIALKANALSYLGADRKIDSAKYQQLAGRPISERTLDVEAQDALYRAAEKRYPLAMYMLAMTSGETMGDGSRDRLLALAGKLPQQDNPSLRNMEKVTRNYERIARHMNSLGQSLATPKVFMDAQVTQMVAAMTKACGLKNRGGVKADPPALRAIAVSRPLSNAVYLPSKVPGYERAYLVSGDWDEDWTYRVCGKTETVTVKFLADGFGGARFTTSVSVPGKTRE